MWDHPIPPQASLSGYRPQAQYNVLYITENRTTGVGLYNELKPLQHIVFKSGSLAASLEVAAEASTDKMSWRITFR